MILTNIQGVKEIHGVGKVNEYEQGLIDACVKDLAGNIKKGVAFGKDCQEKPSHTRSVTDTTLVAGA